MSTAEKRLKAIIDASPSISAADALRVLEAISASDAPPEPPPAAPPPAPKTMQGEIAAIPELGPHAHDYQRLERARQIEQIVARHYRPDGMGGGFVPTIPEPPEAA